MANDCARRKPLAFFSQSLDVKQKPYQIIFLPPALPLPLPYVFVYPSEHAHVATTPMPSALGAQMNWSALARLSMPLRAVALAGFLSTAGQILVVRELVTLFSGYEPAVGALFAGWLFWSGIGSFAAGRACSPLKRQGAVSPASSNCVCGLPLNAVVALVLAFEGLALPATLLATRAARLVWSVPLGELPSLVKMLAISWSITAPFCLANGALFSLCWAAQAQLASQDRSERQVGSVYVAEAAGAVLGGMVFFSTFWPALTLFALSLGLAWIAVVVALGLGRDARRPLWIALTVLAALTSTYGPLEKASRVWQWSADIVAVRETPFQNLVLTRKDGQYSLFTGGAWAFSLPDVQSDESGIHWALLQHPAPRRLLCIGGDIYGLAHQAFKHPSLVQFDHVDPDPAVRALLDSLLPTALRTVAADITTIWPNGAPRASHTNPDSRLLRIYHHDAAGFVREVARQGPAGPGYDVVLLFAGEPLNVQRNRFYTLEFFERISALLAPGGIFSFSLPAAPEAVGPAQARQLQRAYTTLETVFPEVATISGEELRFFARQTTPDLDSGLARQPEPLLRRLRERALHLDYLRPDQIHDALSPFKNDYLDQMLTELPRPGANRDFMPSCFADSLALWSLQAGWKGGPGFWDQAQSQSRVFWLFVCLLGLWLAMAPSRHKSGEPARQRVSIERGIFLAGAGGMVLEVGVLLGYQILEGELHSRLALLVAAYMAGLAAGAALPVCGANREAEAAAARQGVLRAHALLCLALAVAMPLLWGLLALQAAVPGKVASLATATLLSVFCAGSGWVGGRYFSWAVRAVSVSNQDAAQAGAREAGNLYALDLCGAAAASILVPLVVIPLYGLAAGFGAATVLCLGGLSGLWRSCRGPKAGKGAGRGRVGA